MGVEDCEHKCENDSRLPQKAEESIKKIIKKEGYIDYKLVIKPVSTDGGNYFGSLFEVDVTGKTKDGEKETNLFVKGIIRGDLQTVVSLTDIFVTELFFYKDLAVVLNEIQNEAKVPINERYNVAKTFQESIPEAIIFVNLAKKGYKTVYRMDPISLEFAELSIIQLGRLHGLSFALEKKRPDYFDRKIKSLSCPFNFNEDMKVFIANSTKAIAVCLDDDIDDIQERFTAFLEKSWINAQKYYNDQKYKRTIIHCDYKANNIMMKEIDGKITDVIPVDYQFLHYGCPLIDFFYFIFPGTDQHFRKHHLEHLKDLYFDSLTKILDHFKINVKSVFPREDFEVIYSDVIDFGLYSFVQVMPFIFASDDEIPKLDKDSLTDVVIKSDPRMKERAKGIVNDYIRWGKL